jgi:hypothetical protein
MRVHVWGRHSNVYRKGGSVFTRYSYGIQLDRLSYLAIVASRRTSTTLRLDPLIEPLHSLEIRRFLSKLLTPIRDIGPHSESVEYVLVFDVSTGQVSLTRALRQHKEKFDT